MNSHGILLKSVMTLLVVIVVWIQPLQAKKTVKKKINITLNTNSYESLKKRLGNILNELSIDDETLFDENGSYKWKHCTGNNLYEEVQNHMEKFNDAFLNPKDIFKRRVDNCLLSNLTNQWGIRTCLDTEYNKRLNKLDKNFDNNRNTIMRSALKDRKKAKIEGYQNFLTNLTNASRKENPKNRYILTKEAYNKYRKELDRLYDALYKSDNISSPRKSIFSYAEDENDNFKLDDLQRYKPKRVSYNDDNTIEKTVSSKQSPSKNIQDTKLKGENDLKTVNRRQIENNQPDDTNVLLKSDLSSSYPSVLTKQITPDLAIKTVPFGLPPRNLLATVAQKMNTTTLELAKKLVTMTDINKPVIKNDPKLSEMLQKYIASSVLKPVASVSQNVSTSQPRAIAPQPVQFVQAPAPISSQTIPFQPVQPLSQALQPIQAPVPVIQSAQPILESALDTLQQQANLAVAARACATECGDGNQQEQEPDIADILQKVLEKLEKIHEEKVSNSEQHKVNVDKKPEGAPCSIIGSWNSYELGLRFDISSGKAERKLAAAEKNNKLLRITVGECTPPKHHELMSTDWIFMGSAIREYGGPLYLYSQRRANNILATFAGYCRTCGGIDTIFGSWTFVYPSNDCQDIISSVQYKRDMLRRYNMEAKQISRYKNLLFEKSKFPKSRYKDKSKNSECDVAKKK